MFTKTHGALTVVKSPTTLWAGTPATFQGWPGGRAPYPFQWGAYGEIYTKQLWVSVLVNKIANATARLPGKVYERESEGRKDAASSPFGRLMARPSSLLDPFSFWQWTRSTLDIYGEAFWGKLRDAGGRPVELVPLHPTNMHDEVRDGKVVWEFRTAERVYEVERRDLVHFKTFNPNNLWRGLSPLEPLRSTLENEDGARRANSALWRNGGRPSGVAEHPQTLSEGAIKRLSAQFADIHGGVDNWGKWLILEEGMKANTVPLNVEELQYIEARKLNREECCAAYDVPPPAVQILDRATFSNITENLRSLYRDTMAPKLGMLESTVEFELRDGRFSDRDATPDFGEDVYFEFLMDGVLRGDFEKRTAAYQQGIQSGWLTPAEARELENLPFIEGSNRLLVNAAIVPLDPITSDEVIEDDTLTERVNAATALIRAGFEPAGALEAVGLDPIAHLGLLPITVQSEEQLEVPPPAAVRSLLGRLGRCKSVEDIDISTVPPGLVARVEEWKTLGVPIVAARAELAAHLRNED